MKFIVLTLLLAAQLVLAPQAHANPAQAIKQVMANQQDAWNKGDLKAFMAGYWHSDKLRFASGNSYRHGWQTTLDNYIKGYPDRATMGHLTFDIIEIETLSADVALVFGHWQLATEKGLPQGLFTLVFRKINGQWLITRDHTSSAK